MRGEDRLQSVYIGIVAGIKCCKDSETSDFNKGKMEAYSEVLSSMGIKNEDICVLMTTI